MSDLLNQASLVMVPSGYKEDTVYSVVPSDGSGDLSFTRASNGTRINSAGLVEVCPWNIVEQSETFDSATWTKSGGSTITSNNTTAPNGTLTADRINVAASTYSGAYQLINQPNGIYTNSIYAKAGTFNYLFILINGSSGYFVWFNLSTGTISSTGTNMEGTIESVGNGWYRCTASRNLNNDRNDYIQFGFSDSENFTPTTTGTAFIWGAQANIGATAKPYFPTTDRLNVPRLTYQNGGGGCPSLLLEKQSTNLAIESEQLNLWNGANASVTANTSVSPDGTQNADNVNITATNGYWRRNPLTFANSTSYTASIFVKKSATTGTKTFGFYYNNNVGSPNNGMWNCVINLTNITATTTAGGTAGTGIPTILSTNIVDYGSGWYRVEVAFTTGSAAGNSGSEIGFESNGVVVDFLAWGAQVEQSSYATSYIPTTSASATRVADACSKTGISSLIGQTEGAFMIDVDLKSRLSFSYFLINNTTSNYIGIGIFPNSIALDVVSSNVPSCAISLSNSATGRFKIAGAYANNDFVLYINGTQVGTDTSGSVPATNQVDLYYNATNTIQYNEVVLFKTRLTNAELASLTTI